MLYRCLPCRCRAVCRALCRAVLCCVQVESVLDSIASSLEARHWAVCDRFVPLGGWVAGRVAGWEGRREGAGLLDVRVEQGSLTGVGGRRSAKGVGVPLGTHGSRRTSYNPPGRGGVCRYQEHG